MHSINILFENVRGLKTKTAALLNSLATLDPGIEIVVLVETWLNDSILDTELVPPSFNIFRKDRDLLASQKSDGGGVAILVRNSIKAVRMEKYESRDEMLCVKLEGANSQNIILCGAYIPPRADSEILGRVVNRLDKATDDGFQILCVGDFNLPGLSNFFLGTEAMPPQSDSEFIEGLSLAGLNQCNRIQNSLGRLLDLVLSNIRGVVVREAPDVLINRENYHPPLEITVPQISVTRIKRSVINEGYNWSKGNFVELYHKLRQSNWTRVSESTDVDSAVECFYDNLENAFQQCIPKVRARKERSSPPWFTPAIKAKLKEKERLRRRYKRTENPDDYRAYSAIRSELRNEVSREHRTYISKIEDEIAQDPNNLWSYVRQVKGKGKEAGQQCLSYKGAELSNNKDICQAMATHFKSVYSPVCPPTDIESVVSSTQILDSVNTLAITDINAGEVAEAIAKLKPKKSAGPDGVPQYILKAYGEILAMPLCHIFNLCLSQCKFPSKWKISTVCPVPKKLKVEKVEDHRPISLICAPAKIFEAILYDRIFNHVKTHISQHQYGFMPKKSTATNLVNHTQKVLECLNNGTQMDVIYTDFSKAFDSVQFPILLKKLRQYGFSPELLKLIKSYLYGRMQSVKYAKTVNSDPFAVNSGIAQGSKLGPLFFLIMINDLVDVIEYCNAYLLADDLKLSKEIRSKKDHEEMQKDIDAIMNWSTNNQLFFNIEKCAVVTFSLKREISKNEYKMGPLVLSRKSSIRDLGVIFDSRMNFAEHINAVVNSSFRMLGFLKRTCRFFNSRKTLIQLYNSYIRSKLEYCAVVWDPIHANQRNQVERVQKKFVRYMNAKMNNEPSYRISYGILVERFNMDTLEMRRKRSKVIYLFKVLHGLEDDNSLIEHLCFHVSHTRSNATFRLPQARIGIYEGSPALSMCKLVNNFNIDLFRYNSIKKFRDTLVLG